MVPMLALGQETELQQQTMRLGSLAATTQIPQHLIDPPATARAMTPRYATIGYATQPSAPATQPLAPQPLATQPLPGSAVSEYATSQPPFQAMAPSTHRATTTFQDTSHDAYQAAPQPAYQATNQSGAPFPGQPTVETMSPYDPPGGMTSPGHLAPPTVCGAVRHASHEEASPTAAHASSTHEPAEAESPAQGSAVQALGARKAATPEQTTTPTHQTMPASATNQHVPAETSQQVATVEAATQRFLPAASSRATTGLLDPDEDAAYEDAAYEDTDYKDIDADLLPIASSVTGDFGADMAGASGCAACGGSSGGCSKCGGSGGGSGSDNKCNQYKVIYDKGFLFKPCFEDHSPFELKINGRMQFRHAAVKRDRKVFIDNAGVRHPLPAMNEFEIERGRLQFSGYMWEPELQYYLLLDGDTDENHDIKFHDFWVNYKFSDRFDLYCGKHRVPGSREWLESSSRFRFSDRTMATTFFRPDRTTGVWARGTLAQNVHYLALVGNGFQTTDLTPSQVNDEFTYSATSWWDVFGNYGQGFSDLSFHESLAVRLGHSFAYAGADGHIGDSDTPIQESNFVRLSDGTLLTETGALTPGVTVDEFDVYLYAIDVGAKLWGISFDAEYYFRWVQNLAGNGPLPHSKLYDHGYYAEAGIFLVPELLELNGRISEVHGLYGNGAEYACGIAWYFRGDHNWKLNVDCNVLDSNPAENSGPNLRAGEDGMLFRGQLQAAF
jgi:hypothetical protein